MRLEKQLNIREVKLRVFGSFSDGVGADYIRKYEEDRHDKLYSRSTAMSELRVSSAAQLEYE